MRVKEYFKKYNVSDDVTFIIARAEKDTGAPFYHAVYTITPILSAANWKGEILDYIVLNDHQPPLEWLSGAKWSVPFNKGYLRCMLVIKEADLKTIYKGKQAEDIEKYCETQFKETKRL